MRSVALIFVAAGLIARTDALAQGPDAGTEQTDDISELVDLAFSEGEKLLENRQAPVPAAAAPTVSGAKVPNAPAPAPGLAEVQQTSERSEVHRNLGEAGVILEDLIADLGEPDPPAKTLKERVGRIQEILAEAAAETPAAESAAAAGPIPALPVDDDSSPVQAESGDAPAEVSDPPEVEDEESPEDSGNPASSGERTISPLELGLEFGLRPPIELEIDDPVFVEDFGSGEPEFVEGSPPSTASKWVELLRELAREIEGELEK